MNVLLKQNRNITVIGTANSVELLKKFCGGSKKEAELVEEKLIFEPYKSAEIQRIVLSKLEECWTANSKEIKADGGTRGAF